MRLHLCPPLDPPLPWTAMAAHTAQRELSFPPSALDEFDLLVHELNPGAPRTDATRLVALVDWLERLSPEEATAMVECRLQHVGELGSMLVDDEWDTSDALRQLADRLLAYVDRDDDLIPDHVPRFGLLDDALLVELAWPVFAQEVENYLDFCDYRRENHLHHFDERHRLMWWQQRLLERALWMHSQEVRHRHYADVTPPERVFRVS